MKVKRKFFFKYSKSIIQHKRKSFACCCFCFVAITVAVAAARDATVPPEEEDNKQQY